MTSRDFCYWLQGFFEINGSDSANTKPLNFDQIAMIQRHLALVFKHEIDPSFPAEQQAELNEIHKPSKPGFVDYPPGVRC